MGCFGKYLTHAQICDNVRVHNATQHNGRLRYILYTCPKHPKLWYPLCSKCYGMDCFGTYFTHAQSCDNVHVQSAMEWAASVKYLTHAQICDNVRVHNATQHMPKFKLWQRVSKCYGMGGFGTYFTHARSCDILCVESATEWTASVHILRMPKAVITFMFKVLWNGLLR